MKKFFTTAFIIMGLYFCTGDAQAQELQLTIRALTGAVISGQPGSLQLLMGEVDGLGVSPNRMGEVVYDSTRRGAFYDIQLEIITEATGGNFSNGTLTVTRSRAARPNDIPTDALYDADFTVRFGAGADIHVINDAVPYIIRSNLTPQSTSTRRKLGVFVSENLPPSRYEAEVFYTFTVP